MVSDVTTAQWLALTRDMTDEKVRVIRHKVGTKTSGPHVHIDARTDYGDKTETEGIYTPTRTFE